MNVARWYNNRDIRLEEEPTPRPGPGEVLVRVMACGICGSDIVEWYRLPRAPLVQGHEIAGLVEEVGPGVEGIRVNDRVALAPKVPCGECRHCLAGHHPACSEVPDRVPGGFAEYVLVPPAVVKAGTYHLPDGMSFDTGTFMEPLACVVRAQRLADIRAGQRVLIIGCGMSGLLHVKLARSRGARVIATDINPDRLAFARRVGADVTLDAGSDVPGLMEELGEGKADAVILCASALSAIDQAWEAVDKGGVVVFFTVPEPDKKVILPVNRFWTREIRVITSYYCGPDDLARSLELLSQGAVDVEDMITHRLPLEETGQGFGLVLEGRESIKVIIKPGG